MTISLRSVCIFLAQFLRGPPLHPRLPLPHAPHPISCVDLSACALLRQPIQAAFAHHPPTISMASPSHPIAPLPSHVGSETVAGVIPIPRPMPLSIIIKSLHIIKVTWFSQGVNYAFRGTLLAEPWNLRTGCNSECGWKFWDYQPKLLIFWMRISLL